MRRLALILLLCLGVARAEDFLHETTGLQVRMPEGWDRDSSREGGSILFAAVTEFGKGLQVRFEVAATPDTGYEADAWLKGEREAKTKLLKEVTANFTEDRERVVGGRVAAGYTVAGTYEHDGKALPLHFRVYAVTHGGTMFQISEIGYNGAEKGQDKALDEMWDAIAFVEPKQGGGDLSAPPGTEARAVEDKIGNFALKMPAGWAVETEVPADDSGPVRFSAIRQDHEGNNVAAVIVWRWQGGGTEMFVTETPTSVIEKNKKLFFERYFGGEGARYEYTVNEGVLLGGVEKSGEFKVTGNSLDEVKQLAEAEQQRRRGVKIEMPDIPPRVVFGRIAMLSPHIYIVAFTATPKVRESPEFQAEVAAVLDSFQFASTEAKPPPLNVGGEEVGVTLGDPALATDRKEKIKHEASAAGKVRDSVAFDYVIPAGFKKLATNGDLIVNLAAQDSNNKYVHIMVIVASHKAVGFENKKLVEKDQIFNDWASNWESRSTGKNKKKDPANLSIGGLQGEGYKFSGNVDNFPATETNILAEKSGWRLIVEIDTRAGGDVVFKKGIETFLKNFKMKR